MDCFKKTKTSLNQMFTLLQCVKCSCLSKAKIFILYQCNHKYCEKCVARRDETCNICSAARKTQGLTHDLLSTNLLNELRKFQDNLNSLIEEKADVTNCEDGDREPANVDVENMEVDTITKISENKIHQNVPEIFETQVRKSLPPVKPKKIFAQVEADKSTTNAVSVKEKDNTEEENNDFLNEILYPNKHKRKPFQPLKTYKKSSKPKTRPRLNFSGSDSEEDLFTTTPPPVTSKGNHNNINEHPPDLTPYGNKSNSNSTTSEQRKKIKMISFETGTVKDVSVPSSLEHPKDNDDLKDMESIDEPHSPPPLTPYALTVTKKDDNLGNNTRANRANLRKSSAIKESSLESKIKPRSSKSLSKPTIPKLNKESPFTTPIQTVGRKRRASTASVESTQSTASSTVSVLTPGIGKRNAKGETQLHVAARKGDVAKVKELITAGVDLNACDYNGYTALHEAISSRSKTKNNFAIAKVLCEAGCNVNIPAGDFKETPLHEAARVGSDDIVSLLLSHKASPNIRNAHGCLARDVTNSEAVMQIIVDAASLNKGIVPPSQAIDDPAVLKIQSEKALVFFAFDVPSDVVHSCQDVLKIKVSSELKGDVTHIIFGSENCTSERVSFGYDYLYGIMNGSWMLTSKWIDDSLSTGSFINPKDYEIIGCKTSAVSGCTFLERDGVPKRARINKELGNPGLFHGMNFLLYKRTIFDKLTKKDLISLITVGNGCVINREPNPDAVDPMENPVRFHSQDPSSKLILTSHVILFDQPNEPTKKFNMEHVKSLTVNWLIDSIGNFKLSDPDDYLNF